jgi:hypothetical protein
VHLDIEEKQKQCRTKKEAKSKRKIGSLKYNLQILKRTYAEVKEV